MAIQLKNGEIFFAIPKTGSTHVEKILRHLDLIQRKSNHKHATPDYLTLHYPKINHQYTFVPRNILRKTNPFGIRPNNSPSFFFVRNPFSWYESYYRHFLEKSSRQWGNGEGLHGRHLKRYYWHPWKELGRCRTDSFDKFMEDVVYKCPGYLSRLYFSYLHGENTLVGRTESLETDLENILGHFGYSCGSLHGILPNSNATSKREMRWDEDIRRQIEILEAPVLNVNWSQYAASSTIRK